MSDWLQGKKTIISAALLTVFSVLNGFGVIEVPQEINVAVDGLLGALIIFFRIKAKKVISS